MDTHEMDANTHANSTNAMTDTNYESFIAAKVASAPEEAVNALRGMGEAHGVEVKTVETAEMKEGEAA